MKKRVLWYLLLAVVVPITAIAAHSANPWEAKLPFQSATITYKISGMEEGAETVYIKDWGQRKATHHEAVTTVMGMRDPSKTLVIEDPDYVYSFDLLEKTGTRATNPLRILREEYEKLSPAERQQMDENSKEMGIDLQAGLTTESEENVTEILGQKCDCTKVMGSTVYTTHDGGILMKSETEIMGMKVDIVATSFDTGTVDETHFAFPAGIEPIHDQEADMMTRRMMQQTVAWLKDPDAKNKKPQLGMGPVMGEIPTTAPEESGDQPLDINEAMEEAEQVLKSMQDIFGKQ